MTIEAVPPAAQERTLAQLAADLREDVSTLARQELDLAKAELVEKGRHVARGVIYAITATVIGAFSIVALTVALIVGLAQIMPTWIAAAGVTLVYLLVAMMFVAAAKHRLRRIGTLLPTFTVHRIKEDLTWLKRRAL